MSGLRLAEEAIDELAEAAIWYRDQRPGLELAFLAEVESVLPLPRLLDLPTDLEIRRALLPRFPYAVVFMELGTEVRVLAVAHAKRRPGYRLDRVETGE